MLTDFKSRVLRTVHERIMEDQDSLRKSMDSQIIRENASATGMNCAQIVGKIAGLELALTHMKQVHAEMTGKIKPKKDAA